MDRRLIHMVPKTHVGDIPMHLLTVVAEAPDGISFAKLVVEMQRLFRKHNVDVPAGGRLSAYYLKGFISPGELTSIDSHGTVTITDEGFAYVIGAKRA